MMQDRLENFALPKKISFESTGAILITSACTVFHWAEDIFNLLTLVSILMCYVHDCFYYGFPT